MTDGLARRARGAALGLVADRVLGEPPDRVHPVAAFGRLADGLEELWFRPTRSRGSLHAAVGTGVGVAAGGALRSTAVAVGLASSGRALGEAATAVGAALAADDLATARALLPALVGRDPEGLDAAAVARAVVESVAENTVDAVVAPALWGTVAGAPGALGHRAANTLDAMVGHRSARYDRFGWASARLDDAAAWVPARATAALVVAARPRSRAAVVRAVRHDAPAHPSPNAGVAEAAFAAALGLRLGGPTTYDGRVEERPVLGRGRPPGPDDIARAVALALDVEAVLAGLLALASVGLARATRTRRAAEVGP